MTFPKILFFRPLAPPFITYLTFVDTHEWRHFLLPLIQSEDILDNGSNFLRNWNTTILSCTI